MHIMHGYTQPSQSKCEWHITGVTALTDERSKNSKYCKQQK